MPSRIGSTRLGNSGGVVLVVRVEHDDGVRPGLERGVVAGLLVAAVAEVLAVDDHVEAEMAGDGDRVVPGYVVDQDDLRHDRVRNVAVGSFERLGGVVGRHDDDDALTGRRGQARAAGAG